MTQPSCSHCRLGVPLPPRHRVEECAACGRTYLVELKVPAVAPKPDATLSIDESLPGRTLPPAEHTMVDDEDTPPHGRPAAVRRVAPPRRVATRNDRIPEATQSQMPQASLKPGTMLGGYQLVARIGAGGMGTVWLARQLSLDRNVAVKILRPALAKNPAFVVQFAHEALAAAQLVHHNIAQIYDTGTEGKLHFFSMEYVEGESLSAVQRREGKLDSEVAAGYMLQAARGLKFAHDRALIHRDIKPENLLLNRDGIVKVADLGLVKKASGEAPVKKPAAPNLALGAADPENLQDALGTPQFMAPEQANDAATIDARADIYSLGCTLYSLVAGRPPFEGDSSVVVMTKHFFDEPVPPEQHNRRIPAGLSAIILKMLAKKPEQRYQTMDAVIAVLEDFLGVDGSAVFSPREEHAALLEHAVEDFNGALWSKRRRVAISIFFAAVGAVIAGAAWLRAPRVAVTVAVAAAAIWASSLAVNAFAQRTPLLLKLRQLVLGASPWLWLAGVLTASIGGGLLGWYGLLRNAVALVGLAVLAAIGFYLVVDRRLVLERRSPVDAVEQMLKSMRLKGLEEMALRQFVCKYSGQDWEPLYEALFGYDAKLLARTRWGRDEKDLPRKRRGVWRDPLVRWLNRRLNERQQEKDRRHLESLEGSRGAAA